MVDTLASDQGYRNVLVVRGESSQGLEVDSESGFAPADGALALLCRPTGKAAFRRGALGGDPAQEWLPLSIPLNTDIRQVGDVKGHSTCRPNLDCPKRYAPDSPVWPGTSRN